MFMLGLSEGNVEFLKLGRPIVVDLKEIGGAGRVMIFYGETEEKMREDLLKVFDIRHLVDNKNPNG